MATEYEILNTVANGGLSRKRGRDADFDAVLPEFLRCEDSGYLAGADIRHESQTGQRLVDFIAAHRLTASGERRLNELKNV